MFPKILLLPSLSPEEERKVYWWWEQGPDESSDSQLGVIPHAPNSDFWQCLETCLVVTTQGEVLQTPFGGGDFDTTLMGEEEVAVKSGLGREDHPSRGHQEHSRCVQGQYNIQWHWKGTYKAKRSHHVICYMAVTQSFPIPFKSCSVSSQLCLSCLFHASFWPNPC